MADPASFIASWLTPSLLFIFVNLVIGTIAITSRFAAKPENQSSPSLLQRVSSFNRNHNEPECTQPQLVRTPSLLERLTSFNLAFHKHEPAHAETQPVPREQPEPERPELVRTPSLLQRIQSMNLSRLYKSDSMHREDPDLGKAEIRKSASGKEGSMESEWEEVEKRRPATATARIETTSCREDEEVDAKADDFINRFKKQLRLQRIDSLLRYREMLRGGNS